MFNTVKKYYDKGFYTDEQVKVFVVAAYITPEQYNAITGIEYVA